VSRAGQVAGCKGKNQQNRLSRFTFGKGWFLFESPSPNIPWQYSSWPPVAQEEEGFRCSFQLILDDCPKRDILLTGLTSGGEDRRILKSFATVLLLIALAFLIEYLIESSSSQENRATIVGYENDSVGGRYIYMSNGEVYHRPAPSRSGTGGSTYNASSLDNGSEMSDRRASEFKKEAASNPPPEYSRDRGSEEGR
jgi:hypothetical protein